jgi:hypothetical protein
MIPLPIDQGDGVLLWQPRRWRAVIAVAVEEGACVQWHDGTDMGVMTTTHAGRVLDVLRSIYDPPPRRVIT